MTVTFVDNYDSFTYNLVEYVSEQGHDTEVLKNRVSLDDVRATDPDAIVISPGPGHPKNDRDVGVTREVIHELSPEVPTLGVCLGMEAAAYEFGGTVGHAPEPVHGKAFPIEHDGKGVYAGLPQGFQAGRYHSLVCTEIPDCFDVTATTEHEVSESSSESQSETHPESGGGTELAMGIRHEEYPLECVQFHPESVLTAVGHDVVGNFLAGV